MTLFTRLFFINALGIVTTLALVFFIVREKAASYFMALADNYGIAPAELHTMFLQALNYGFLIAGAISLSLVGVVIFLLTRKIVHPINRLSEQFVSISAGSYSVRADLQTTSELDDLAQSFNRMAAELEKQEQLRRRMIVDVTHELKTPITSLRCTLEGLQDGVLTNISDSIDSTINDVDRLTKLVNEILDLARLEAGRDPITLTKNDLVEITENTFSRFQKRLAEKNLTFNFVNWPDKANCWCDREKIIRIVDNLLSNIERYAPANGSVNLEYTKADCGIRLNLVNDAPNINASEIGNLFERFYRGDLSRSSGGSGLGLAIVKQLVELHGGQVGATYQDRRLAVWFEIPNDGGPVAT